MDWGRAFVSRNGLDVMLKQFSKSVTRIGLKHCHGKVEEDSHDHMIPCYHARE